MVEKTAEITKRLVGINEVAEYLGISKHTIYAWVHSEAIPYIKLGGLVKFDLSAIERWLRTKAKATRGRPEVEKETDL